MTASLIAAVLTVVSLAVLCGPPAFALRMLWLRLRWAGPQSRLAFLVLCAVLVLILVFNALFAIGMTGLLGMLTPPLIAENPGTAALLFAWAAAGLSALLAVIAPRRGGASRI